jgi:uncharacterized protein (DUF1499 family)
MLSDLYQSLMPFTAALALATLAVVSGQGTRSITDRLAPCPNTPNCVSTLATDRGHAIEPIAFTGSAEAAKAVLLDVIAQMPRRTVVADEATYLHVEFRSLVFRFVDDVEFVLDDEAKLIHFRSAARLGRGDLGVNRRRMERIRSAFSQAMSNAGPTPSKSTAGAGGRA